MITGTIALNLVATLLIFVLEFTNVHTIGNLSLAIKSWLPISKQFHHEQLVLTQFLLVTWKIHLY